MPSTHRSAVQTFPSSQSESLAHAPVGSVVVVVGGTLHRGLQISFGFRHGWSGAQGSSLHWSSTVTKQRPCGGGHRPAGPGQQLVAPVASPHTQMCSQLPSMQWSRVHPFPSSHS